MKILIKSTRPFEYGDRTKKQSIILIEIEKFEFKCESGNLEFFISDKTEAGELISYRSIIYTQAEVDGLFQNFGIGIQQSDSFVDKTKEILLTALLYTMGSDGSYGGDSESWEIYVEPVVEVIEEIVPEPTEE